MSTAQARSVRAATPWPPPNALLHTRPWRSSPLAGPAFLTLPPAIPESSEESHENEGTQAHPRTRSLSSSSIVSHTGSLSASASGYASGNTSGSALALALVEGDPGTSSASLSASTGANGTSSSHGHASSQAHSNRPKRLSKSWARRPSSAQGNLGAPKNASDVFIAPPPRARTVSHGHLRPMSFPVLSVASSQTMPPVFSRASPRPSSPESNTAKQPPSTSRDPSSNWMSSSPFGPAQTPKFSRLTMASPAVVMPLSAKEYRKQKARQSLGHGKEKEPPTSSNRVAFVDNALTAFKSPIGVPVVKVSPPPSEDVHRPPSSGDPSSDRSDQQQPQVDYPPPKPFPGPSMSPRPSSPKQKRPRSRPDTPPRSSPLASHPPISPKSSTGTFFSFTSTSDDNPQGANDSNMTHALPPARPRPRPGRRKSYPDRLSNGARLSLLEAMNRLSQESTSLQCASAVSPAKGPNRLSVASQASGHTLFYDVVESEGEQAQATNGDGSARADGDADAPRTPAMHTQSLEDLSSTLARTGIAVVGGHTGGPLDDERKGKRNVRMVRISDTVEVSPPPVPRRRKLTKSRPGPSRGSTPVPAVGPLQKLGTIKEVKTQTQVHTQERRGSLLPWKSKGSNNSKVAVVSPDSTTSGKKDMTTPIRPFAPLIEATAPTPIPNPISPGLSHIENQPKPRSNGLTAKKASPDTSVLTPAIVPSPDPESTSSAPPRKSRRYTFSFLPAPIFHLPKREKSNAVPPGIDPGLDHTKFKGSIKGVESGTDSTSTSIRTITQGSQSTLLPAYDLTTSASLSGLSGPGRDVRSPVPMLRKLTLQEMATAELPMQHTWEGKGDSTPSLVTNGSTATSSSSPRTPSYARLGGTGGESFVPRPSGLKESYTDTSEEDLEGTSREGTTLRPCMRRKQESSPLARPGGRCGETSEEDERYLRPGASAGPHPGSRPGTASSTATETSGSYLSFSTVPASTTSSSSTSRSTSPSPVVGDKRDRTVVSAVQEQGGDEEEDEAMHACAMCGHRLSSPLSMRDPDPEEMHPMFTVPLVTVPASAMGFYPRASSNAASAAMHGGGSNVGTRVPRYARRHKSARHASVPVPAIADVAAVLPTRHDQGQTRIPVNLVGGGGPVTTTSGTMEVNDEKMLSATTTITTLSSSPSPPGLKGRQRRRPQTAPAGTSDATRKFVEDAVRVKRVHEGSVDAHVYVGLERLSAATKHKNTEKAGSGQSRFKTVLKGLLKRTG